jgi:hypothetical protein
MGPYAGVDLNLTLCPLQSRLQHIYHGQPYARVDLKPRLESTLSPSQGLWILAFLCFAVLYTKSRPTSARILKRLRRPGIESDSLYVAWRACTYLSYRPARLRTFKISTKLCVVRLPSSESSSCASSILICKLCTADVL